MGTLFRPCLEITFSLVLGLSACYIANRVKMSTGKKQNTCLLAWHIVNLLILIVVTTLYAIYYLKRNSIDSTHEDFQQYRYYEHIV